MHIHTTMCAQNSTQVQATPMPHALKSNTETAKGSALAFVLCSCCLRAAKHGAGLASFNKPVPKASCWHKHSHSLCLSETGRRKHSRCC